MSGPDLFKQAFARKSDPDTSKAAAKSVESEATRLEGLVFDAVKRSGSFGITWDEAVVATGLPAPSISPRWKPLRRRGLIKAKQDADGIVIKRAGKSGRGQIVWVTK